MTHGAGAGAWCKLHRWQHPCRPPADPLPRDPLPTPCRPSAGPALKARPPRKVRCSTALTHHMLLANVTLGDGECDGKRVTVTVTVIVTLTVTATATRCHCDCGL
jgi:hypothetical protein